MNIYDTYKEYLFENILTKYSQDSRKTKNEMVWTMIWVKNAKTKSSNHWQEDMIGG
jgi:hypothetical protein